MPGHHRISDLLSYSCLQSCTHGQDTDLAVIHACKEPCHRHAANYKEHSLPGTHPHYLAFERGHHLYLNLIDPPVPLFKPESFEMFFRFANAQIAKRPLLIHCNQGESRAPSLALLYMAKRLKTLPDESYAAARTEFEKQFPYKPGKGIEIFLTGNWNQLGAVTD